jgi:hypothetical protein
MDAVDHRDHVVAAVDFDGVECPFVGQMPGEDADTSNGRAVTLRKIIVIQ